ncbi:dual oxidase 1-like [Lampetra fluviatilis]
MQPDFTMPLLLLLLCSMWLSADCLPNFEVERYDGWYNNLVNIQWGCAGSKLLRLAPASFADGVYQMWDEPTVPNARRLSSSVMRGDSGLPSALNRTVLAVFFGQQILNEIMNTKHQGCPAEFVNIRIPSNDSAFSNGVYKVLPFQRSHWDEDTGSSPNNPRTPSNMVTAWIDGNSIYGSSQTACNAHRKFAKGMLKTSSNGFLAPLAEDSSTLINIRSPSHEFGNIGPQTQYVFGSPWANESPSLKALSTVWLRYHNYWAQNLSMAHPDWNDEEVFSNARKWVVAIYQNIILYEWLPAMLGQNVSDYTGYKMHVHPGISVEFEAAAMRYSQTMLPPGVYTRNESCHFKPTESGFIASRVCNNYWNHEVFKSRNEVDEMLLGMASQIAEREDHIVVEDILDRMYGPLKASRLDLMAMNIQQGRDHGAPSYNEVRRAVKLPPVSQWGEINPRLNQSNPEVIERLKQLYNGDISRLELWPGGLMECQGGPGPLFSRILVDQFERIRDGDRFWFENTNNGMFTDTDVETVRGTRFSSVLRAAMMIDENSVQEEVFFWRNGDPCEQPKQLRVEDLEVCTPPQTIDYFSGSVVTFIITNVLLLLIPAACVAVLWCVSYNRKRSFKKLTDQNDPKTEAKKETDGIPAREWQGKKEPLRDVRLRFDDAGSIKVLDCAGALLRSLEVKALSGVELLSANDRGNLLLVHVPKEYDLVIFFESTIQRSQFEHQLKEFVTKVANHSVKTDAGTKKAILKRAVTKEQRKVLLETSFKKIFSKVLKIDPERNVEMQADAVKQSLKCELSREELGELLGLKPSSTFMQGIFHLTGKDDDGYLSFNELTDVLGVFITGTAEEKSKQMFDMYATRRCGPMTKEKYELMLRSFLEMANYKLQKKEEDSIINALFSKQEFNKTEFTWQDLHALLDEHYNDAGSLQIHIPGMELPQAKRQAERTVSFIHHRKPNGTTAKRDQPFTDAAHEHYDRSKLGQKTQAFKRYVENYRRHIFCVFVFYAVMAGVMVDRAFHYPGDAKDIGIQQVTEVGIRLARGSAAGICLCYSFILLTMCRNIITALRETRLNHYIPFDSAVEFHRMIAMTGLVVSIVHTIGHVINVYYFSIIPLSVLSCLFPSWFYNDWSEIPPKFYWWYFQTIPGLTGVLLLVVLAVLYIFASRFSRSHSFNAFWLTHQLYFAFYILMLLHGSVGLVQKPRFYMYFLPPALIFMGDRLLSLSRRKVEIDVIKAELLPSGVTHLEFKRPHGFEYKSGQLVRVACLKLGRSEYHPFTLTSAPHENTLSVHVRAVGPWTTRLRETYSPDNSRSFSKIYLDGPFGEGHQHWNDFEVSVLVGGGIGVTPFASILKDIVHKSSINARLISCKKVYFIWVTRTQRQFEWLTDIIREVEENDKNDLVSTHTYITQFAEKFDLRTAMLYICERHFQKVSNRSLFTGLRSITHFGRPQFVPFLNSLQNLHPKVGKIGIFSCGPPGLTKTVEKSCRQLNGHDQTLFVHHYENF